MQSTHRVPRRPTTPRLLLTLLAAALAPTTLEAQIRGSERALLQQTADGTTITVDYARPHLRGRSPAFPGIVAWDHVWTPGANQATTFQASRDVTVNGVAVPEGIYSVWMVPRPDTWDVIFEPDARLYHTQPPEVHDGQIRLTVTPRTAPETEALTFDVPRVRRDGMDLRFRWGTVEIPLTIDVPPSRVLTVDEAEARRYVGRYQVKMAGPPPPGAPRGAAPPPMAWVVTYEPDGRLLASIEGGPPMLPAQMLLVPAAEGIFNPAWMEDGQVFETEVDMFIEFEFDDGVATRFDVRGLGGRIMMRGERASTTP